MAQQNTDDKVVDDCCLANQIYEQSKIEEKPTRYSWIDDFLFKNNIKPPTTPFCWTFNPDEELWNKFVFGHIRNFWSLNKLYDLTSCPKEIVLLVIAYSAPYSSDRVRKDIEKRKQGKHTCHHGNDNDNEKDWYYDSSEDYDSS